MKKRNIFTVFISTILCFSVLTITTKANFDYNVKSLSYTHGSVSISSGINAVLTDFGGGSSTADICNYLSFQFDKYYSGTVTLKWTYSSSAWRQNLTDWNILVIGGKIESNNNTSGNIVFRVYDTDSFLVVMTYSSGAILNGTDPTFSFSSASSSLTVVTNHNELYNNVDNIDSQLSTTNTQLGGIVSLLGALQALQNTISSNVIDIADNVALESDGITNTDVETKLNLITSWIELVNGHLTSLDNNLSTALTNQNTCNEWLENIEGEVDGVEELLGVISGTLVVEGVSVFTQLAATQAVILAALTTQGGENILDIVSDLVSLIDDPNNGILPALSGLNTLLVTNNSKLDDIKTTLGNLLTSVNNIDNQIDTITWNTNNISFVGYTNDFENFIMSGSNVENYYAVFQLVSVVQISNSLFNFTVNCDTRNVNNNEALGLYYVQGSNHSLTKINPLYSINSRGQHTYLFDLSNNTVSTLSFGNPVYLALKFSKITFSENNYKLLGYIENTDIEYWTLLSYFKDYEYHKKILDLLSIDVDSETSLTIYNSDQTTLDNIDTGLNNEYQTYLPFVNQQIVPLSNTTFLNEMSNQRTLFDYIFRNVFNLDYNTEDPSTVTNPIFLILIFGGILLALVG